LTFRPLSEAFIRRSWYSVLLDDQLSCQESGRIGIYSGVDSCPRYDWWLLVVLYKFI